MTVRDLIEQLERFGERYSYDLPVCAEVEPLSKYYIEPNSIVLERKGVNNDSGDRAVLYFDRSKEAGEDVAECVCRMAW